MTAVELGPSVAEEFLETVGRLPVLEDDEGEVPNWKGKGKAIAPPEIVVSTPEIALTTPETSARASISEEDVDWTQFEPPAALRTVQEDIDSDIITQVIQESIDRVKARIEEVNESRKAADEAERLKKEQALKAEEEQTPATEELELDVDSGENTATSANTTVPQYYRVEPGSFAGVKLTIGPDGLLHTTPPPRSKKRSLMGLLRRLNNTERGESSAQGAARNKLKPTIDFNTLAAKKHSAAVLVKKAVTSSSPQSSIHEEEVECVSCLDDFSPKDMIKAPCHSYCQPCFRRLIETATQNEQQWPPKCCLNNIPERTIISNTDSELQREYRLKAEEWGIPIGERIYCPQRDCGLFVRPDQINYGLRLARCSAGHWTCSICLNPQHTSDACPQDRDMQRTEELAEEEGWKRCIGCRAYVEHREACQHMTCRCGAQFCYVCGARWRTCACTMEQLHALKQNAAIRRRDRQAEQEREEAEIAEALRQVEEFEREEARKAELLRLERERIEEERRARELQERIQREGERRAAVEAKFHELRERLGDVHEGQRIAVVSEHGEEQSALRYESETAAQALREKNSADRETVAAATADMVAERERAVGRDYAARVKHERQIEDEYQRQLGAYWAGKRGGEEQAEAALLALRRRMDKGFRAWRKWMDNEFDNYRYIVQEEQSIQFEMMEEAERRLAQINQRDQEAFARRKIAELQWVDVVIKEREMMLNEMEVDELENGEDIEAWFAEEEALNAADAIDDLHSEYRVPGAFS
ncbi:hypothetical protein JX266_002516 [Neoarthrinium moseri]|nr:hypothetical protein JX266_002516 [Neoarthrinium moseri]